MKRLAKILGILVLIVVLLAGGLIAVVECTYFFSERAVVATVVQLTPGTPFAVVVQRLGKPVRSFTDAEEFVPWVEKVGSQVDEHIANNSILHKFVHRGPPFRYILVYTDRQSERVVRADWCDM